MENYIEFEMPTPCTNCGAIFELNDGGASEKWYPNTIICRSCFEEEQELIEREEEIETTLGHIEESLFSLKEGVKYLVEDLNARESIPKETVTGIIEVWRLLSNFKPKSKEDVQIAPAVIHSPGDETVGLFSATWVINEEIFIHKDDIEKFRENLSAAFEIIADDNRVFFNTDPEPEENL